MPDAMKRTAAQAGFPVESQTVRVTVCVPADRCTRNAPMVLSLVCHNSDNVDAVKKLLTYRIREVTGRCPLTLLPATSEWQAYSVHGTDHNIDHSGCSAFRSDRS